METIRQIFNLKKNLVNAVVVSTWLPYMRELRKGTASWSFFLLICTLPLHIL